MAEAVVEDRTQQTLRRFYCHKCGVEVENVTNEFTCPLCAGGFIEELPANTSNADTSSTSDVEMLDGPNDSFTLFEGLSNRLTDELSTFLMPMTGGRPISSHDDDDNAQNPSGSNGGGGGGGTGGGSGGAGGRHFGRRIDNFNVLQDFLISVTGAGGGAPMFFMGNPGDYAWGREGLDTIVTQLLNQMDTTGPPPMSKEQIQEVPKVDITQDQVDKKEQCSVCWDVFRLEEKVRKLSCSHVYHENCIVPWLELHGTCPVCRKSFVPEYTEEQQRNQFSATTANNIRHVVARTLLNQENNENLTNSTTVPRIENNSTSSSQPQNLQPHPLSQSATPSFMRIFPNTHSATPQSITVSLNHSPSTSSNSTPGPQAGIIGTPTNGSAQQQNTSANNTRSNNSSRRNPSDEVDYEYD